MNSTTLLLVVLVYTISHAYCPQFARQILPKSSQTIHLLQGSWNHVITAL